MALLLLEEDRTLRGVLKKACETLGYRVSAYKHSRSGLQVLLSGRRFHSALVNYDSPDMGGMTFTDALAAMEELSGEHDEDRLSSRIIFMSRDPNAAIPDGYPLLVFPFDAGDLELALASV